MRVEVTTDIEAFWAAAGEFLLAEPVLCSVILTNVASRRGGVVVDPEPARWAVVRSGADGAVVGAAMWTPPSKPFLAPMPTEAAAALVAAYADAGLVPLGVTGPTDVVDAFVAAWTDRHPGATAAVTVRERIHTLGRVVPPPAPTGRMRVATADDRELVRAWHQEFSREISIGDGELTPAQLATADARLDAGRCWLWEDEAGEAAYVGASEPIGGVVRIAPVYTPPDRRGHGYASALVAGVSQTVLDSGHRCTLYTDLANPTSNKIYAAVGYQPLRDVTVYEFG